MPIEQSDSIKKLFIFMVFFMSFQLLCEKIDAQENGVLSGKIIDAQTGLPLSGANITLIDRSHGDVADSLGVYRIADLPQGTYVLEVSRIGYETQKSTEIQLKNGEYKTIDFRLTERAIELQQIIFEAEEIWQKQLTNASSVNVELMTPKELKTAPASFDDILRAVQLKPSVTSDGDYSSYYSVRGGNADQNLVIIDGIVIQNPYRFRAAFGAAFSDINPNTVKNARLHLGGYSAEYGNALSSVLEIATRPGNYERLSFQGSLNITDMNGLIEGPLMNPNGSFIFSFRRTYFDLIGNSLVDGNSALPSYREFSGRLDQNINSKNKLSLSFKNSEGGVNISDEVSEDFNVNENSNSEVLSLTWHSFINDRFQNKAQISYYNDKTAFDAYDASKPSDTNPEGQALDASIQSFTIKEDLILEVRDNNWLNAGFSWSTNSGKVDFASTTTDFIYARRSLPNQVNFKDQYDYFATYLEFSSKLTDYFHLRTGLRYDHSTMTHNGGISPRLNLWFALDEKTELTSSWGIVYQYLNPMSIYSRDQALNLGANIKNLLPEKATHYAVGIKRELNQSFLIKLNLFYRETDRFLLPENEELLLPHNNGFVISKGLEVEISKNKFGDSRIGGFVSYSIGDSKYRTIDENNWIPLKFDRRHSFKTYIDLRISGNWSVSILGQTASGFPYTDVAVIAHGDENWSYFKGNHNATNFPTFKKVDLRLNYAWAKALRKFNFYIDFLNITNEKNVYEIIWNREPSGDNYVAKRRVFYMLPFLPSFGLNFKL